MTLYLKRELKKGQGLLTFSSRSCKSFVGGYLMNKTELVKEIAGKAKISMADTEKIVNGFIESVSKELKKKGTVTMVGFGTFKVQDRKARTGINPQTKEKIQIKAKRVPKFVPGKTLKELVK